MSENITGSIKALIGADTADYKRAMAEVVSSTTSTMNRVQSNLTNSTNSIVSKVGSIMGQLSSTIPSKLNSLKSTMVTPFSTAGGQIQRIIASIGEKIPDPIRKGFSAVSKAASETSSLVSKGLNKIITTSSATGSKIGSSLTNAFNKIGSKAASSLNNIGKSTEKTISVTDGLIKKVIGLATAYAGLSQFKDIVGKAIGRIDTIDTATKSLTVLTGSSKKAQIVMDDLAKGIEGTPIALNDVALGAKKMVAAGMEASKVKDVFKSIADAAYGVGNGTESIDQMTDAISSLQSSGVAYSDDINRLVDAGIPAWQMLANMTGKSVGEMKEYVSEGSLESKDAIDMLTKGIQEGTDGIAGSTAKMAGLAKTAGDTISGSLANLRTSFVTTAAKGLTPFKAVFIDVMQAVTDKVKWFRDEVIGSENVQKILTSIANALSNVFDHFINGTEISGDSLKSLQVIIQSILPVASVLSSALLLSNALPGIKAVSSGFTNLSGVLTGPVSSAFSIVSRNVSGLVSLIPQIGDGLSSATNVGMSALGGMTSAMATIVQVALSAIGPAAILGLVVAGLGIVNNQFGTQIDQLLTTVTTKGPEVVRNFVLGINSQLPNLMKSGTDLVIKLLSAISANLYTVISMGTRLIMTLVNGASIAIPRMIPEALKVVTTLINGIITNLPLLIQTGLDLILSIIKGIIDNMPQIITSAQSILKNFVTTISDSLPQMIQTGIQILLSLINGLSQMLPQLLPVALQAILQLIQGLMNNIPLLLNGAVLIVQSLCSFVIQNLPMILQAAVMIIQAIVTGIVDNLPYIITSGIQIIFSLLTTIVQMLPDILVAGWEIIKSLASGVIEAIPNVLKSAWDAIKNGFGNLWDTITGKAKSKGSEMGTDAHIATQSVSTSFDTANSSVSQSMSAMQATVSNFSGIASTDAINAAAQANTSTSTDYASMASTVSQSMSAMENSVKNGTSNINQSSTKEISAMAQSVTKSMQNMEQTTSNSIKRVNEVVNKGFSNISKLSKQSMQQATQSIRKSMSQMTSFFSSGMNQLMSVSSSSVARILQVFSSMERQMSNIGYYAGIGLASGLSNSSGYIYSIANNIASNVSSTIQRALDIHSPSRITMWMGEMLGKGLGLGMQSMFSFVSQQAKEFGSIIKSQNYEAEAVMVGDTTFTHRNINTFVDEMDKDIAESELKEEQIYVYNELVGDKIYTTVKRKEARNRNKDKYFN